MRSRTSGTVGAARRLLSKVAAALAITLAISLVPMSAPAAQAAGNINVSLTQSTPASQPTGSQFRYTLNFDCAVLNAADCLTGGVITIPLQPNPGGTVTFPATLPTQVKSAKYVNGTVIVELYDLGERSDSFSLDFWFNSPINQPNGTEWSMTATVTGTDLATPISSGSISSSVTSTRLSPYATKVSSTEQLFAGDTFTYTIYSQSCNRVSTGIEPPMTVRFTDVLPVEVEFVRVVRGTATYDPATHTVSGSANNAAICNNANGPIVASFEVRAKQTLPANTEINNTAQVTWEWADSHIETAPAHARPVVVSEYFPPIGRIEKLSSGPLKATATASDKKATYPGPWKGGLGEESSYTFRINSSGMDALGRMSWSAIDNMPCLVSLNNTVHSSLTDGSLCVNPAWHPVQVSFASGTTQPGPVNIQAVLTDGSTVSLIQSQVLGSQIWTVPASAVGKVSRLVFPKLEAFTTYGYSVKGYADQRTTPGNRLRNQVDASFFDQRTGLPSNTASAVADLFIIAGDPVVTFEKRRPSADTYFLVGTVTANAPVIGDVVLTDLLPVGRTSGLSTGDSVPLVLVRDANPQHNQATLTTVVEVIPNFDGHGRELIRARIVATQLNSLLPGVAGFGIVIRTSSTVGSTAGTFVNEGGLHPGFPMSSVQPCATIRTDTGDLNGDGDTTERFCHASFGETVPETPGSSSQVLVKEIKGNLDSDFAVFPKIGTLSGSDGSAQYRLTWTNMSATAVNGAVLYDVLPHVGDTGVSHGLSSQPRGTEFRPTFTGIGGTLPAGVAVQYSTATNPCRDEVFPNSANAGCIDDWSGIAPSDLAEVTALRFASTERYGNAQGFQVLINVDAPQLPGELIAWNSAAISSTNATSGVRLSTLESPKVGLGRPPITWGSLQLTKLLSGVGVEPFAGNDQLEFHVVCAFEGSTVFDQQIQLHVPPGVSSVDSTVLGPLQVGASCVITETVSGRADAAAAPVTVIIPDRQNGQDPGEPTVVVSMTNYYSAGTLAITKKLEGDEQAILAIVDFPFEIQVTCQKEEVRLHSSTIVTLYSGVVKIKGGQTKMLVGVDETPRYLPLGAKCFGTEIIDGGAVKAVVDFDSFDNAAEVTAGTPDQLQQLVITATNTFVCTETLCPEPGDDPVAPGTTPPSALSTTGDRVGGTGAIAAATALTSLGLLFLLRRRRSQQRETPNRR